MSGEGALLAGPVQEKQELGVPIVGRKGPAMAENDRLPRAPILEEDLRAFGRGDRAHALPPPLLALRQRRARFEA